MAQGRPSLAYRPITDSRTVVPLGRPPICSTLAIHSRPRLDVLQPRGRVRRLLVADGRGPVCRCLSAVASIVRSRGTANNAIIGHDIRNILGRTRWFVIWKLHFILFYFFFICLGRFASSILISLPAPNRVPIPRWSGLRVGACGSYSVRTQCSRLTGLCCPYTC